MLHRVHFARRQQRPSDYVHELNTRNRHCCRVYQGSVYRTSPGVRLSPQSSRRSLTQLVATSGIKS